MRRATNAAAPERAKTLHRVRLFEDDARVDVTHPDARGRPDGRSGGGKSRRAGSGGGG